MSLTEDEQARFIAAVIAYDEALDAGAALADAFTAAQSNAKPVLVTFGADWCPDCQILSGMMALEPVKAFVERHFNRVSIPVGRYDLNMELPPVFGLEGLEGVPALIVATPERCVLNPDEIFSWRSARTRTQDELVQDLTRWMG